MQRLVKVDGKVRTDATYPAGFMDVIDIEKTDEHFRLIYDSKGRFVTHRITKVRPPLISDLFSRSLEVLAPSASYYFLLLEFGRGHLRTVLMLCTQRRDIKQVGWCKVPVSRNKIK